MFSDLVFGDPATYFTLDGKPHTPKKVPAEANATSSFYAGGDNQENRAFSDIGPYTVWRITDESGNLLDEYVKTYRAGRDTIRRNLILQHYGAPTSFIDVTHDIRVAEWFALHNLKVDEQGLSESSRSTQPMTKSSIFVLFSLDQITPMANTTELVTPEEALRPHRQACAVLGGAGNLYRNAAARFIGLKIKFHSAFVPKNLPTVNWLFPSPDEDPALKKLLDFNEGLSTDRSLFPVYWFPNVPSDQANSTSIAVIGGAGSEAEEPIDHSKSDELLGDLYGSVGFPHFAVDLGILGSILSNPNIYEGSHYRLNITGALTERSEGVATALGRIMQRANIPPAFVQHFAESDLLRNRLKLSDKLLELTEDPNPQYQMNVQPEYISGRKRAPGLRLTVRFLVSLVKSPLFTGS